MPTQFKDKRGNIKTQTVFKIETASGETKLLSFNQKSMDALIDVYGNETETWIDKEAKIHLNKETISGRRIVVAYVSAPDWTLGEDEEGYPYNAVYS